MNGLLWPRYIAPPLSNARLPMNDVAMIVAWLKFGKPDVSISFNGVLAGLVGITAPCAAVTPLAAVAIGASAAFATPVSSPVVTLVVAPGNYSFLDFIRVGLPLLFHKPLEVDGTTACQVAMSEGIDLTINPKP